jgi:hypothetical protein
MWARAEGDADRMIARMPNRKRNETALRIKRRIHESPVTSVWAARSCHDWVGTVDFIMVEFRPIEIAL